MIARKIPIQNCTGTCIATTTSDANGIFTFKNLDDGNYDIYYGNESLPAIAIMASQNGEISGSLAVTFTVGTVSTGVAPADPFVYGHWDTEQLTRLKTLLVAQSVLTVADSNNATTKADLKDAIIAFQKKYGITQTGQLGPKTVAKLNSLL